MLEQFLQRFKDHPGDDAVAVLNVSECDQIRIVRKRGVRAGAPDFTIGEWNGSGWGVVCTCGGYRRMRNALDLMLDSQPITGFSISSGS